MTNDRGDGFQAEVHDSGGVVKGMYWFAGPKGKILTKTYLSYSRGYRLAYLSEMGVALPPPTIFTNKHTRNSFLRRTH